MVTWPSPPRATRPSFRTARMVVPWKRRHHLRPRMRLLVHLLQSLDAGVGVHLRRAQTTRAPGAPGRPVGRRRRRACAWRRCAAASAPGVRRRRWRRTSRCTSRWTPRGANRLPRRLTNTARRSAPRQRGTCLPEVKIAAERQRPRASPTGTIRSLRPLPRTLAWSERRSRSLEVHAAQLRESDAGRIEQLEHGQVARRAELVTAGARLGPGEEALGLSPVEVGRQPLVESSAPLDRARRRVRDTVVHLEDSDRGSAPPRARAPPMRLARPRRCSSPRKPRRPSRSTVVPVPARRRSGGRRTR